MSLQTALDGPSCMCLLATFPTNASQFLCGGLLSITELNVSRFAALLQTGRILQNDRHAAFQRMVQGFP